MRDSRSRLVNLIACQSGRRKAKLLKFKPEWLRDGNDRDLYGFRRQDGRPVAMGRMRRSEARGDQVTARKEFRYEFGIIAVPS
jgi:hypothetical protein